MYDSILRLRLDDGVRIVGFANDIAVVAVAGTTYEVENLLSHAIARVDIQRSPQSDQREGFESGVSLFADHADHRWPQEQSEVALRQRHRLDLLDPIWSCGTGTQAGMRRAKAIHRRACLRVISGRPHLSYDATYVLASIPPLALLAVERSRLYHEAMRTRELKNARRH
ncbi:unnamed protein product [Trichogramma brassicae]|uniref:Reverse transcriptase domain-containing protein n=1 Tax=Trichogramma brassicae TaxID=86971 RepID=A0A6H5IJ27_9HYME|nr:unnamed protein product [Trichogramma brassicae]